MAQRNPIHILLLLFVGVFMGALDMGIVGPALPAIQPYFGVNERLLSWIFTIYILFYIIGTPLMAKLSDIYGRKFIYILDIILFGVGSYITIASVSFEMLLIGRAIQGFGAGGIFPVANAYIGDIFPPEKRGGALGILSSVWGLSFVLGPILGGLLLNYSWQWLFIINIPISIIVVLLSLYMLPTSVKNLKFNFDWKGLVILGVLVTLLSYGINQIDAHYFLSSLISLNVLPFLIISLILFPLLWRIEKNARDPLIPVNLFKIREVKLVNGIMFGTGLMQASTVFVPAFVIAALSFTPSNASLMLLPIVLTMAIGGPIIGKLLDNFGSRNIMFIGISIMVFGLFILGFFPKTLLIFIIAGILIGIGMSTAIGSPPRYIMLLESPPKYRAAGQGIINIITSIGQLIGGALIGAFIGSYAGEIVGYEYAFMFMGIAAIVMSILAFNLKSKKEQVESMNQELN
jgi:EmrB/QacA subfamily drug resistance transporter